jgi:hypothetical protein
MKILIELLIIGFFCNGLSYATNEGMILFKPHQWLERKLPTWIFKPLIGCVNCMASIWGTTLHFILGGSLLTWPIVIVGAIFVNGLMTELYNKLGR